MLRGFRGSGRRDGGRGHRSVDQFGAVQVSEVGVLRANGVQSVAAFLDQLNATVPDGFEFGEGRGQRAEAASRAEHARSFHLRQTISNRREKPNLLP